MKDVYPSEVVRSCRMLKLKKSAGADAIEAEHLKYGGFELAIHMSIAFSAFLRHSFIPSQWLESYIVPIVKDKKGDSCNPNNYRGIAISCVMSKLLESILLERVECNFGSCERQFGFKKLHSCADCSFVLKESVNHFLERGNKEMFLSGLDLSKAFDRVSHYRLFNRLLDTEYPVYFVKFLQTWYENQNMWNNRLSEPFGARNRVRQGSVLSPSLFNIYIDDLLHQLEEMVPEYVVCIQEPWRMRMI